jgi:hypothetical protein
MPISFSNNILHHGVGMYVETGITGTNEIIRRTSGYA